MIQIQERYSLKNLNTFGVEAEARWYTEIDNEEQLKELFQDSKWDKIERLVLGGGSNMLFTHHFDGIVIRMNIHGIAHRVEGTDVYVTGGAGEIWNDLVNYCVDRDFSGIENLSLIPGSVGASPIQNIGAYGVELKDIFYSCKAFEISTGEFKIFDSSDCLFGYRDSIFKSHKKGKFIITEVIFKLSTLLNPNISYGAIQQELNLRGIIKPTVKDISSVVSHIRVNKLPDPSTIGNAGSFFKNPIITIEDFAPLQAAFPDIVNYSVDDKHIKLAAGWLIEACGWKGKIVGNTGTWKHQALVLVNYDNATGTEIFNFSSQIIKSVADRFNIILEREVNII